MWSDFCVSRHINVLKYTSPACIVALIGLRLLCCCVFMCNCLFLALQKSAVKVFNTWYCCVITQTCSLKKSLSLCAEKYLFNDT